MVAPTVNRNREAAVVNQPKSKSEIILLWIVKILLVLIILFMLPKLVNTSRTTSRRHRQNRRQNRKSVIQIRQIRFDCALDVCTKYVPEESLNCVFACLSPSCYGRVYGENPLEDGEVVDSARAIEFDDCVKDEFNNLSRRRRMEKDLFREDL